jgi:hypothetical protein
MHRFFSESRERCDTNKKNNINIFVFLQGKKFFLPAFSPLDSLTVFGILTTPSPMGQPFWAGVLDIGPDHPFGPPFWAGVLDIGPDHPFGPLHDILTCPASVNIRQKTKKPIIL